MDQKPFVLFWKYGFHFIRSTSYMPSRNSKKRIIKHFTSRYRIIHHATYQSFQQLQDNIIQLQRLLKQMSTMQEEVYVVAFSDVGLDYLLTNQHISTELFEFAESILAPLTKYDE